MTFAEREEVALGRVGAIDRGSSRPVGGQGQGAVVDGLLAAVDGGDGGFGEQPLVLVQPVASQWASGAGGPLCPGGRRGC